MRAILLHRFGGPEVLKVQDVKKPEPTADQVLIRIKAIGINPVDTKVRAGTNRISKMIRLPTVIGWDVSGVIESCGAKVTDFQEGDEVFGCIGFPGAGGGYAAYAVASPGLLVKKPATVSFDTAAALPIAGLTAYQSIHEHLKVKSGQNILIQAAAGGVGHLALQLAGLLGATVSGTASSKNKSFLLDLGIDQVIDYKTQKFEEQLHDLDAVQDAMGGDVLYRSINCVKKGGRVVCLPSSTKDDPAATALAQKKEVQLTWPIMRTDQDQLQTLIKLVEQGKIKVHIDKIFAFEEMQQAHKAMESGHTVGKIVVKTEG